MQDAADNSRIQRSSEIEPVGHASQASNDGIIHRTAFVQNITIDLPQSEVDNTLFTKVGTSSGVANQTISVPKIVESGLLVATIVIGVIGHRDSVRNHQDAIRAHQDTVAQQRVDLESIQVQKETRDSVKRLLEELREKDQETARSE